MQIGKTELLDDNFERRIRALEVVIFGADQQKPLPYSVMNELHLMPPITASQARVEENLRASCDQQEDSIRRMEAALRAIIARADTDKPGTSKVQDMRYIAEKALEG